MAYVARNQWVSIHAPARGATRCGRTAGICDPFQSTRPRGARRASIRCALCRGRFQSTRPRGARRGFKQRCHEICHLFQSTRPRGARPDLRNNIPPNLAVSIHAPARGATTGDGRPLERSAVSIHAPARGATLMQVFFIHHQFCFNPRAREGRDDFYAGIVKYNGVSIHAPARGATFPFPCAFFQYPCFNPRAREGRDAMAVSLSAASCWFQSTRPRGARRNCA